MIQHIRSALYLIAGVLMASVGLRGFLIPNRFIDGGLMGVSLLVTHITKFELALLIVIFNLPFIALGYLQISRGFAFKSVAAIVSLALAVHFIDIPTFTDDKLLISIFGGFFLGSGIGLSMRGGGVIDGAEVLALYLNKSLPISIGGIILIINLIIFSIAAYVLSVEAALYSILIYLVASKTVDFIVHGIEEYTGLMIISEKSEEIRRLIINKLARGATIFDGKRGFRTNSGDDVNIDIIYTVVTRLEIVKVTNEILEIDRNAFIIEQTINDVRGGLVKRRRLPE